MPKKPSIIVCLLLSFTVGTTGCEPDDGSRRISGSSEPIPDGNSDTGSETDFESTDTGDSADDTGDIVDDTGDIVDDTDDPAETTESATGGDTEVCEAQPFTIKRDAGRLMILQDLSWSMTLYSRWEEAKEALERVLDDPNLASIEYGFDSFPTNANNGCGIRKSVLVDCGPHSRDAVFDQVASIEVSNGATPLYCAMKNFLEPNYAPGFSAPDKSHFLLVVSDGQPTCPKQCNNSSGTPVNPGDMADLTEELLEGGTKTLAIGFKYATGDDPEYLTQIASHGGTGYSDYIQADDEAEFEEALKQVAGSVVSCTYSVETEEASADPNKVNFYFSEGGKERIVKYNEGCKGGSGWTWTDDNHDAIELCKDTCEELKTGTVDEVIAKFGCKTVVV